MFLSENISLSARLSLHLASTPPDLPQQSDRNHLQDALVLRLRTQFDHENTPTATAAQLTLPYTNHLNTFTLFTRTNKVLHVSSTSENAPWCNMSTVQSLIELPKVARQNTHTLKAPSTQQFHCAKSPRDCKKQSTRVHFNLSHLDAVQLSEKEPWLEKHQSMRVKKRHWSKSPWRNG